MKNRSSLAPTLVVFLGAASLLACRSENIDSGSTPAPTQAPAAVTVAAVTATPTATTPPPRPKAKIAPFAEASKALDKRCVPKLASNANNVETKAAAAQTAECMKKAFTADLDAVIVPTKATDPARFNALMREQASWNKLAEDLCWLAEESFWVDFDKGLRDDGTMRGLPWVGCKAQAASERDYYALALKADDASALATRIEQVAKTGTRAKELLAEMSKGAATLAETRVVDAGPPGSYPHLLTTAERSELVTRTKSIEDKSREVAHATCTWAALAETLGGSAACEEAATLYYLGHGNLEGNRGH